MDLSVVEWVAAMVVTAFGAAVQGSLGLGFNIVILPFLLFIDPRLIPVPQLLLSILLTVATAIRERNHIDFTGVGWIISGRLPGALIGVWLVANASDRALDTMIGVLILGSVLTLATGMQVARNASTKLTAGVFAGVASYVASIGGPPVALLYRDESGPTIRATLATIFFVGSSITVLARVVAGDIGLFDVKAAAILLPAAAVGFLLSSRLKESVKQSHLRLGVFGLSTVAALVLLASTWLT